ncbi:NADH-quinone oxidoreductase subunit J [Buchnera aphidicola (Eriosoma lanigerum)]|uniref:NADH-quinone oxidoreductase subunit J n=1 Tax=Buchnera aphidicola TaxID=9 RepID=UPI0034643681
MELVFYLCSFISVISTLLVLFNSHPMYALLYFIISILSISGVFFSLGAYFSGVIEVIIYAGAIMVLFVFVVMVLNLGEKTYYEEKKWMSIKYWIFPAILSLLLLLVIIYLIFGLGEDSILLGKVTLIKTVGFSLFGMYMLLLELVSLILLSALVITFHFGKKQ